MSESTPAYLYPQDVADILGVGVSTVKRMVDAGRLPARQTTGRHRRIAPADVLRLVQSGNYPCARPDLLERLTGPVVASDDLVGRLEEALLRGDVPNARALLVGGYERGLSVARLGDEVIAPAMARIGHCWERGDLDVYQEHLATQTCLAGLLALRGRVERPPIEPRLVAAGGGPEGDHYLLANALIELLFVEMGWEAVNVGPNTPFDSLASLARQSRPRILWVSCSYLEDEERFVAGYSRLYREVSTLGVEVLVGGNALSPSLNARIPSDHSVRLLEELAAFARSVE